MKHLIIGAGNLGKDLLIEINAQQKGNPRILSLSKGFDVTDREALLGEVESGVDVVWYCVGGGSIAETKDPAQRKLAFELNTDVPIWLAANAPERAKVIFFSTDYAADTRRPDSAYNQGEPLSQYAADKQHMETRIIRLNRPGHSVVRVGSLYGTHKPERTFPGKILARYAESNERIELPSNLVTPTPSRWLAHRLVAELRALTSHDNAQMFHCAPQGNVTVKDWAKFILCGFRGPDAFFYNNDFFDKERPHVSNLGCSFGYSAHWHELFQLYFAPEWFLPKELRHLVKAPEQAR